jgi:hypothetical protein
MGELRIAVMLGLIACSLSMIAPVHAESVSCPLTTADRRISNPLPPEWRPIPFAERLTGTRVTASGVLQTLICEYGEAGQIQREAPADTRCTARVYGFDCVGTVITSGPPNTRRLGPTTIAHYTGTRTIRFDVVPVCVDFDLDVTGKGGGCFSFSHSGGAWNIGSGGGATFWIHNRTVPMGVDGCTAEPLRYAPLGWRSPEVGHYACYLTGFRRFGELQITGFGSTPGGSPTITIQFTTWPSR